MDEFKAFTLRLPVELYDRVAVAALNDDRSLTNWITRVVRAALEAK
jgi:predicted HicB family RNase H-like nuclease